MLEQNHTKSDIKSFKDALQSLSVAEKSCREEANSEPVASSTVPNALSGDRSDGLHCIADSIAEIRKFFANKRMVYLTKKQVAVLRELAGNTELDDLLEVLQ